jgi:hypothetical protein
MFNILILLNTFFTLNYSVFFFVLLYILWRCSCLKDILQLFFFSKNGLIFPVIILNVFLYFVLLYLFALMFVLSPFSFSFLLLLSSLQLTASFFLLEYEEVIERRAQLHTGTTTEHNSARRTSHKTYCQLP